ncbi:MAG TPA: hypothetical protein DD670_09160, partial [Planctomycetaceae bacterium]|nr:hypothetical protein [Planctomycetaceae bacterium]
GFYTFEDATASDSSSKGNHGAIVGDVLFVDGSMAIYPGHDGGNYFHFSGFSGNYIQLPLYLDPFVADTNFTVENMSQLTVGGWLMADVTTATQSARVAIGADNGGYDRPSLGFDTRPDGLAKWTAWTGYGTPSGNFGGPEVTALEGWVFLAAVYDNARQQGSLYYDVGYGLQRIDAPVCNGLGGSRPTTYLGTSSGTAATWIGGIDDVFFFDEALAESQIAAIHADTKGTLANWTSTPVVEPERTVIKVWDAESGDLTGWNIVEGSENPEAGQQWFSANPYSTDRFNIQGQYMFRTYEGGSGDRGMGILETDSFTLGENAKFTMYLNGGSGRWQYDWDPDTILATRDAAENQSLLLTAVTLEVLVSSEEEADWEVIRDASGCRSADMMYDVTWDGLEDYEGMTARIRIYDLNRDGWGSLNVDNIIYYDMAAPNRVPGDATGNGVVDEADAKMLAANWGTGNATWAMGDFNDDRIVNALDVSILAAHWGATSGESVAAVPEPGSFALIPPSLIALAALRRRGRQR